MNEMPRISDKPKRGPAAALALAALAACEPASGPIFVPAPPPADGARSLVLIARGSSGTWMRAVDLGEPGAADRPITLDAAETALWQQPGRAAFALYYPQPLRDLWIPPGPISAIEVVSGAAPPDSRGVPEGFAMYAAREDLERIEWAPARSLAGELAGLRAPIAADPGPPDTIRDISVGQEFTCVTRASGETACLGWNEDGRLGSGGAAHSGVPLLVPIPPASQVSSARWFSCAIARSGGASCWGGGAADILAAPPGSSDEVRTLGVAHEGAVQIAVGGVHACVVHASGAVHCFGSAGRGALGLTEAQLGTRAHGDVTNPLQVLGIGPARRAVAGFDHTCALLVDGTVWCWGSNDWGQLGVGAGTDVARTPVRVDGVEGASELAAGHQHTCAIAGAGVLCWGANNTGQLGDGTHETRWAPVRSTLPADGALLAGAYATCVVHPERGATCTGMSAMLPAGATDPISERPWRGVVRLSLGPQHSAAITADGRALAWGWDGWSQLGRAPARPIAGRPEPVSGLEDVRSAAANDFSTCAVRGDGSLVCFGGNVGLILGHPDRAASRPAGVRGVPPVAQLALGDTHACVRPRDPSLDVVCWGLNDRGQVGSGSRTTTAGPSPVRGTAGAVDLSARGYASCVVSAEGDVLCWGENGHGQLGDGTTEDRAAPVRVQGLAARARRVVTSGTHTCALLVTGAVQCWGWGRDGQLGDGEETATRALPVSVIGLPGPAVELVVGNQHGCARTSSAAGILSLVYCWGRNRDGQLGLGSVESPKPPTRVIAADGAIGMSAGPSRTCVVFAGGTARCAGRNDVDQIGSGSADRVVPSLEAIPEAAGASSFAIGNQHTCAVTSGRLVCWGWDGWGQLGRGREPIDPVPAPLVW